TIGGTGPVLALRSTTSDVGQGQLRRHPCGTRTLCCAIPLAGPGVIQARCCPAVLPHPCRRGFIPNIPGAEPAQGSLAVPAEAERVDVEAIAMDDSLMQQHLVHYKQATESAREELAALQTKHQSLHSQLLDARSKISSQEALVQDLREVMDKHKETEARQASLISSLRERIHITEQEMGSITSSRNILDMKLQAITKENEEMKERAQQMEIKSKEYFSNWNKTKQEVGDLQRRNEEFVSRLASKLSMDLAESDKPMDTIISLVGQCCKDRDRQKTQISALEERVKSHEVECKASRETVRRLVADLDHEQKLSGSRASDLNSVRQSVRELEVRLAEVSRELARQTELLRAAEQREQQIQQRIHKLDSELLTAGVSKDGLSHEKQQYLQFLENLSEKMRIDQITTELGFDMRLEAILTRAEQLTRQEGTALVETKTLVYSLQKKVKEQRERLENKELHMELLRKKVAQLDEEKRSRSALSVERDDATLANRKLLKKVERLQAELSVVRFSSTELKAQLADTNELKIRVMEQNQAIQEQSKSLGKLEKNKAKMEKKLNTVKTELQNQEYRARDELLQAQRLLHSQASAMAELSHREKQLLDFCIVVSQMLGVDMPASLPSNEVIKRLEVLIHSCHHHFPLASHCATPHHLMASACSSLTAGSLWPEAAALPPPPSTDTP
ncbi:hypothetical protein NFI96_020034, partial [Prochilodus magdalenae]